MKGHFLCSSPTKVPSVTLMVNFTGTLSESSTVEGQNPANQLRLVVYPIIYAGFIHHRWLFGISEPSIVVHFLKLK